MTPGTRVRRLADRTIAEIGDKAGPLANCRETSYSRMTPAEAAVELDRKREAVEAGSVEPIVVSDALRAVLAKPRGEL